MVAIATDLVNAPEDLINLVELSSNLDTSQLNQSLLTHQLPDAAGSINPWIRSSWAEFQELSTHDDNSDLKSTFYYYQGSYLKEMGVGSNHAFVDGLISFLVNLYLMSRNIPGRQFVNCSYRKDGKWECQPDISYYVGDRPTPSGNSIVDVDLCSPPNLVIEIASSSLDIDLGTKRLLYEEMGVDEYWVVNVEELKIIAFRILHNQANYGSDRLTNSQAIAGLSLNLLEQALQRSRETNNSQIGQWFMSQISSNLVTV
jgi:Uma2 family endonuclease